MSEMCVDFLRLRAKGYAKSISEAGVPLDRYVEFIYCNKMRMYRPFGNYAYQRAVYSGHRCVHCLIYHPITTPFDLMFSLYDSIEGRHHDITLLRQGGGVIFAIVASTLTISGITSMVIRPICFVREGKGLLLVAYAVLEKNYAVRK